MKHSAIFTILLLLAVSIGTARDEVAVETAAAEQPGVPVDTASNDAEQTSPLEVLDWMVAKCEGMDYWHPEIGPSEPDYSTNWAQGGPIIEREKIALTWYPDDKEWIAGVDFQHPRFSNVIAYEEQYGPTPLIAAMRCYVASKLGEEVDVPEELK